ncbi:MAG: hypothetical protein NC307_15940 [Roseburia sp.]|nr:hypothetical protein [Roseburia sp.]
MERRFELLEDDDFYEIQQGRFLDGFASIAGRIMESGVCLKELNKRLTKAYRDMTECHQEYVSVWKKGDTVECAIIENGGELMMEQVFPPEISALLMQRFGEELFTEELDRKLDGVVERLQENADTLICRFASECSTGGWRGLIGEIRGKLEEYICKEMPEAAGRIIVDLEMPHSGTLNCYAAVKGMTAYIVYMDEEQSRNAATAIEERVEELYQASRKEFMDNISQYAMDLAGREDMDLTRLQEELLHIYREMTAEVDTTDGIILFAGNAGTVYFLAEGRAVSEKGRLSPDVSGMLLGKFGDGLCRNAEEYAGELGKSGKEK